MVHGFSDHINCYRGFFPTLAQHGIQVVGWDQRGWGRTVGKSSERGNTGPTARVLADMAAFIRPQLAEAEKGNVPVFVLGHSMGGGQVITMASSPEYDDIVSRVKGWVLESPFIGFPPSETPSSVKVFLGRLAGRVLPRFRLLNKIPAAYLSRDPEMVKALEDDKLLHDTGTLEGFAGVLDRTIALSGGQTKLNPSVKSLLVAHGSADRVACFDASKNFFEKQTASVPDKTFKIYEDAYHQLHADLVKDDFYRDVCGWILQRTKSSEPEVPPAGSKDNHPEPEPEPEPAAAIRPEEKKGPEEVMKEGAKL
jgi:acylglycerol lipase